MPVQFDSIKVGSEWERKELAELWGYKSFHAIARGVFTPANLNKIVLFVTEQKQASLAQYCDELSENTLIWEGEDGHGNDQRIAKSSENADVIHVFYRKRHHQMFKYIGKVKLQSCRIFSDTPSKFVFQVVQ
jgi:putative restriction endonuclease